MSHATTCTGGSSPPFPENSGRTNDSPIEQVIDGFFIRNGFDITTRAICDDFARSKYDLAKATSSSSQGYCSYTLRLRDEHLLQFRPTRFKLDKHICDQARRMFPLLVPTTAHVGVVRGNRKKEEGYDEVGTLDVYLQKQMPGVTLTRFRKIKEPVPESEKRTYRSHLVENMAAVFATSYLHRRYPQKTGESFPRGKVGSSIRERLKILEGLPMEQKQARRYTLAIKERLESAGSSTTPWCLTHGDLVPENILVDPRTGRLSGLIDWAEGEWLPFGVGLYGLEEVFGEANAEGTFEYYSDHKALRSLFWQRFLQITQPVQPILSQQWLQDLRLYRALGILLWRGIAFDDGQLDRVVDAERDAPEIQKLGLFLEAPEPLDGPGWKWRVELLLLCIGRYMGCSSRLSEGSGAVIERPALAQREHAASIQSPLIKPRESWQEVA